MPAVEKLAPTPLMAAEKPAIAIPSPHAALRGRQARLVEEIVGPCCDIGKSGKKAALSTSFALFLRPTSRCQIWKYGGFPEIYAPLLRKIRDLSGSMDVLP